jgi:hypothetical protein
MSFANRLAELPPETLDETRRHLETILSRSATDRDFRRLLLDDPRAALSDVMGAEVPETVDIRFVENTADATIVLPEFVDPAAELTEKDLETVAGGITPTLATIIGFCAAGVALGSWIGRTQHQQE